MKIAIVLAICVIFTSVIYATEAQAELDNTEMVATLQFGVSNPQVYPMIGTVSVSESIFSDIVFAQYSREGDFANIDVKGKIVLAERGGETVDEWVFFTDKEIAAAQNGAVGLIIYNNVPGIFFGELTHANVGDEYTPSIPVVSMSQKDGLQIRKDLPQSHNAVIFNVSPKPELDVIPEPIPELIFEGGDYTIYRGNQIPVPVIVQVENHDHKIFPKIHTIIENKIISTIDLGQSILGNYQVFININENYKTGNYYLQLEYDDKKLPPVPFNIIREHEQQKEKILGYGDYTNKNYLQRESMIEIGQKHIDIEFSTSVIQKITGIYDSRGLTGDLEMHVEGPKNMINTIKFLESGYFETSFIIDREWPTGTYKVSGKFQGQTFISGEFTVKNFNQDSILKEIPIQGIINLDSVRTNQINVIVVEGQLSGDPIPKQVGMKVFLGEKLINTSYNEVKEDGSFQTNLILYDNLKKSNWENGKYTIEITNLDTDEEYGIKSHFEVTSTENVITNFKQGALLTSDESESELLEFIEKIEVEEYSTKMINVFGNIDSYISTTPIIISVVSEHGNVDKFSIFAKKSGYYETPVMIDSEWAPGKYDIYVNYNDKIQNSISFSLGDDLEAFLESEEIEEVEPNEQKQIEKFFIIQNDSSTSQLVNLEFSSEIFQTEYNKVEIMLKKPNEETSMYKVNIPESGNSSVSLFVNKSWDEGDYFLSFFQDDKEIVLGEFSIEKQNSKEKAYILSDVLESANPGSIYEQIDSIEISNKILAPSRNGIYLDISGTIKEYSSGETTATIFEKNVLVDKYKIAPKSDGTFNTPILINEDISEGFHEIHIIHDKRVIGKSEFFIGNPTTLYVEFSSEPIKISQDMIIESNNEILVNISGFASDLIHTNRNSVEITILHPDSHIEKIQVDVAKWGYYSYIIPVTDKWKNGTYVITANFDGKKLGHVYMQVIGFDVNWLKTHTQKWIDGEISSYQYENRINHVIDYGLIESNHIQPDSIPDWMKMSGEKWIDGDLSQKEYFEAIKFVGG